MKKYFYFSAIVCVLLFIFVLLVDATDLGTVIDNLWKAQDDKKTITQNKNMKAIEARIVMSEIATYYNLNAKEINKGKRMTLGSVLKGAATVTVTYVTGGSTATVTVLSSIEPALKSLGLVGSINTQSDLESAYESAISELQSRISDASQAITDYLHAWDDYRYPVLNHNSQYHGSGSSPSDQAHGISAYLPPDLNTDMPKFRCPGGGCNITYKYPSSARTAHYAKCGTKDDPYNKYLRGCYKVFYTCNTTERARHQPNNCGLEKWVRKNGVWSKTACTSDYRNCTQNMQRHATVLGTNQISMCRPAESSSPVASPTPTPTPADGTPNCPDCTTHCSPPCSCTNSGTCNGTVSYHACGQHETSVSGDHSNGTYTCGIHSGYKCQESHDHKTYISSCTSTDSNGNSCTNTGGYYECQPHTHSYPTLVECAHDNCTEMVSSRTSHRTQCGSGQHYYWPGCPNNTNWWSQDSTHALKSCRRNGCSNTWRRCLTKTPNCPISGTKCWAQ